MTLQALERTPPPKKSPNVSPATYLGARRQYQENVDAHNGYHGAADLNMGPLPEPVHHRQEAPAAYYHGVGMPNMMYV